MKKIPTLFTRVFENHRIVDILPEITPGCEEAFYNGVATVKIDGSCCAIIDGKFYKRYDAKKGKKAPVGAIPCCDPDPETGHWPHWVEVDSTDPNDRWFCEALRSVLSKTEPLVDGTYEAVGKHFNGNPYRLDEDLLYPHGQAIANVDRTFDGIRKYLELHYIEGLVFWLNGEPVCKIKRTDFGLEWPIKYLYSHPPREIFKPYYEEAMYMTVETLLEQMYRELDEAYELWNEYEAKEEECLRLHFDALAANYRRLAHKQKYKVTRLLIVVNEIERRG